MGLPSQRRTTASKRRRASHFAIKKSTLGNCQKCKQPLPPHTACPTCGTYRGRTVLTPRSERRARKEKTLAKEREKQNANA